MTQAYNYPGRDMHKYRIILETLLDLYGIHIHRPALPDATARWRWWNSRKIRATARLRKWLRLARVYRPATWPEYAEVMGRVKPGDTVYPPY